MINIAIFITLIALIIASITDIKTREVPDWLNYSLIISGLAINGLFSLIYHNSQIIINCLIGLGIALAFALIMFYTGQWGGGDSKLLIGIGALMGSAFTFSGFMPSFIINSLLVGSIYGLIWGLVVVIKNKKKFIEQSKKILSNKKIRKIKIIFTIFSLLPFLILLIRYDIINLILCSLLFVSLNLIIYVYIFSKIFEEAFMYKFIKPEKLTEGDWIAKNIIIKGKKICGPKDLGINQKQIQQLIKLKIKSVKIKEGIPFVPPFLIAFILTLFLGNIVLLFL
ncbi:MAG: prepilin peptidase [Nanoarchaeota archaeon]|nr:prepilin peptidase [Nanoarchaeota archaeon]